MAPNNTASKSKANRRASARKAQRNSSGQASKSATAQDFTMTNNSSGATDQVMADINVLDVSQQLSGEPGSEHAHKDSHLVIEDMLATQSPSKELSDTSMIDSGDTMPGSLSHQEHTQTLVVRGTTTTLVNAHVQATATSSSSSILPTPFTRVTAENIWERMDAQLSQPNEIREAQGEKILAFTRDLQEGFIKDLASKVARRSAPTTGLMHQENKAGQDDGGSLDLDEDEKPNKGKAAAVSPPRPLSPTSKARANFAHAVNQSNRVLAETYGSSSAQTPIYQDYNNFAEAHDRNGDVDKVMKHMYSQMEEEDYGHEGDQDDDEDGEAREYD